LPSFAFFSRPSIRRMSFSSRRRKVRRNSCHRADQNRPVLGRIDPATQFA
jgi:hypothetical protein